MKQVIGLIGDIGAGKGTFIKILQAKLPAMNIVSLRYSDILREILDVLEMEHNRDNMQRLAQMIDKTYGEGTFANAMKKRIEKTEAQIVVVDGVRWPADEKMVKSIDESIMVYVTADQKIRYERITQRKEKAGEGELTFEEFKEEEQKENETYIPDIGSRADVIINNDAGLEDFENKVEEFIEQYIQ